LRLLDVSTGNVVRQFHGPTSPQRAAAFAPDGRRVYAAGGGSAKQKLEDCVIRAWDIRGEAEVLRFTGLDAPVTGLALSADGRHLVGEWQLPGEVQALAVAPDGRHVASANANGTMYVLRLPAPRPRKAR
jgi:WD40 repeat protein